MEVQRPKAFLDFHANVSLWWRPPLDCSQRRLCSSQAEDKDMAYSYKTLAQTKKEQGWCYDPTIKYESLRQFVVPRLSMEPKGRQRAVRSTQRKQKRRICVKG